MKEGSTDIPAIKFALCIGLHKEDFEKGRADKVATVLPHVAFEDVDGLTIRQFFDVFNMVKDEDRCFRLEAYIERWAIPIYNSEAQFRNGLCLFGWCILDAPNGKDLDSEISDYFERIMIDSITAFDNSKSLVPIEDVVVTFCTRYRGRDKEFINQKVRKKEGII